MIPFCAKFASLHWKALMSLLYLEIQVHCLCTHTLCSVPGITLVGEIQVPQRHIQIHLMCKNNEVLHIPMQSQYSLGFGIGSK